MNSKTTKDHEKVPQGYTLITGASAGIGYELAKVFAEKGHDVVLVARSFSKLQDLAQELQKTYPVKVVPIEVDLTLESERTRLFEQLKKDDISVETLVNNAGFGLGGEFQKQEASRQLEMINLNISALTHLTRLFLPPMLTRGRGFILNLASTAAFFPGPLMAVYYATKAYVISLTVALAAELENTGIHISALCPGPTQTEFQKTASIENSKLFDKYVMDAKTVAEFGYENLHKGKLIAVPGLRNKFLAKAAPFAPLSIVTKTIKSLNLNRT